MVLDIGLPDGDGFNVVDWLRQHEDLADLPLVVYSGRELLAGGRAPTSRLGPRISWPRHACSRSSSKRWC